jgi:hypothetical protein
MAGAPPLPLMLPLPLPHRTSHQTQVTLYTRGKKAITEKIADDTEAGYQQFARSVKHIAGDRKVCEGGNRTQARANV